MVCSYPGDKQAPVCSNVLGLHGHAPTAASGVRGVGVESGDEEELQS